MAGVQKEQCDCEVCLICRKYEELGMPQWMTQQLADAVGEATHIPASEKLAALEGFLEQEQMMYQTIGEMMENGLITETEVNTALGNLGGPEARELVEKVTDYMSRKVN